MRWQGDEQQSRRLDYVPSHDAAMRALPREVRDKRWARMSVALLVTIPLMLSAALALFLHYTRVARDEACSLGTDGAGQRPGYCPPLPEHTLTKSAAELQTAARDVRDAATKLAIVAPPSQPLEHVFHVTPISFGHDVTVAVKKASTDVGGYFRLFICRRNSPLMRRVGEGAYAAGSDDFSLTETFAGDQAVLLLNIEPKGKDAVTVISTWDLSRGVRIKEPVGRSGLLSCADIAGQF